VCDERVAVEARRGASSGHGARPTGDAAARATRKRRGPCWRGSRASAALRAECNATAAGHGWLRPAASKETKSKSIRRAADEAATRLVTRHAGIVRQAAAALLGGLRPPLRRPRWPPRRPQGQRRCSGMSLRPRGRGLDPGTSAAAVPRAIRRDSSTTKHPRGAWTKNNTWDGRHRADAGRGSWVIGPRRRSTHSSCRPRREVSDGRGLRFERREVSAFEARGGKAPTSTQTSEKKRCSNNIQPHRTRPTR